jgi:hypothetical protein
MPPVAKLILVQIVIFVVYIAYIWIRYRVQESISDSWYALKKHAKLFTFFLWAIAIPMCIIGGLTENIWYFLSGGFLCFTAVAADYKGWKTTEVVHVTGAIGGIALALYGLFSSNAIWFPIAGTLVFALIAEIRKISNKTWWVEIAAFIFIEVGLIYQTLTFPL